MKSTIIISLLFFCFPILLFSQKKLKIDDEFNVKPYTYVGVQGTEVFKVVVKCKKQKGSLEKAKKNAVEAILFKGIPGSGSIEPIIDENKLNDVQVVFLNNFLKSDYLTYVNLANDGTILPGDFIKYGKYYMIGYIVSVNKSSLRKFLEENNIIRKLGL